MESDIWFTWEMFEGTLTGAAWDLEAVGGDVLERDGSRGDLSANLGDLEPRSGAVVAGGAAWGL